MDDQDDFDSACAQQELDERRQLEDGWKTTLGLYQHNRQYAIDMARGWVGMDKTSNARESLRDARLANRKLIQARITARKLGYL